MIGVPTFGERAPDRYLRGEVAGASRWAAVAGRPIPRWSLHLKSGSRGGALAYRHPEESLDAFVETEALATPAGLDA